MNQKAKYAILTVALLTVLAAILVSLGGRLAPNGGSQETAEPVQTSTPTPEPIPPSAPEPPKAAPKPITETAAVPDEEPFCFNVMEALVESKAEKYIDLFGLCPCSRCRTDVVALALTRLL